MSRVRKLPVLSKMTAPPFHLTSHSRSNHTGPGLQARRHVGKWIDDVLYWKSNR